MPETLQSRTGMATTNAPQQLKNAQAAKDAKACAVDPIERLRRVGSQRTVFEVSLHEDLAGLCSNACLVPEVEWQSEEATHSEKSYNLEPTPAFCQLVPHCLAQFEQRVSQLVAGRSS